MPNELDDYFRLKKIAGTWALQVGIIRWDGPHTPRLLWKNYRVWGTEPDGNMISLARDSALQDPLLFRTCIHCMDVCAVGHMHNFEICHGCAEKLFGIIH